LQALVTLNDPVYYEAARALAQRAIKETALKSGTVTDDDILRARIEYEARLVLSRDLTARELPVLLAFYKRALVRPHAKLVNASMSVSGNLLDKTNNGADNIDALTSVGSVLFNLDASLIR
jgi:hypothetical protein